MIASPFANKRALKARITDNYPFSHRVKNSVTTSPQVEHEFGPHGSYVEGLDRIYCFKSERVRDKFKEKYP